MRFILYNVSKFNLKKRNENEEEILRIRIDIDSNILPFLHFT